MGDRVVRHTSDVISLGFDNHDGFYYLNLVTGLAPFAPPYVPVPAPFPGNFHFVATEVVDTPQKEGGKVNERILADNEAIVSADHTILYTIHLPLGVNVLIPAIIYMGESSWKLGVNNVQATKGAVASTLKWVFGATINCADPVSMPCGVFWSLSTVHVDTTWGDILAVVADWIVSESINLAVQAGLKMGFKGLSDKVGKRVVGSPLGKKAADLLGQAAEHGKRMPRVKAIVDVVQKNVESGGQKTVEKFFGDGGKWVVDKGEEKIIEKDASKKGWKGIGDGVEKAVKKDPSGGQ